MSDNIGKTVSPSSTIDQHLDAAVQSASVLHERLDFLSSRLHGDDSEPPTEPPPPVVITSKAAYLERELERAVRRLCSIIDRV